MAVKKIILQDLAKLAGTSQSTVSRALRDHPNVAAATKKEIWRLARENNYGSLPPMPASISGVAATISVVVPTPQARDGWIRDPFFLELIGAVGEAARRQNCDLLISHAEPQNYQDLSKLMESHAADCVIFLGQSYLHERLNRLAMNTKKRFIVWGAELPDQLYCSVGSDNQLGGHMATSHLIKQGRRKIAFLGDKNAPEMLLRLQGYREAIEAAGMNYDPRLVLPAHFDIQAAEESVEALIARGVPFDAIFAASDTIGMGAVRRLKEHGMKVPDDVAIVSYDDLMFAQYSSPALTTVRQDLSQAGTIMVAKLLSATSPRDMSSRRLDTNLVIRETCGAQAAGT